MIVSWHTQIINKLLTNSEIFPADYYCSSQIGHSSVKILSPIVGFYCIQLKIGQPEPQELGITFYNSS